MVMDRLYPIITVECVKGKPWREIKVIGDVVGTLSKTTRSNPDMLWFWQAMGTYDHAPSYRLAMVQIRVHAAEWWPAHLAHQESERVRLAEIAALRQPLRDIRINLDQARMSLDIEQCRNILRPADIAMWQRRVADLETEYAAAERHFAEAA